MNYIIPIESMLEVVDENRYLEMDELCTKISINDFNKKIENMGAKEFFELYTFSVISCEFNKRRHLLQNL